MFTQDDAKDNHLLASLPEHEFDRIRPILKRVSLTAGQVIHQPGDKFRHVYFPTTALFSLLYLADSGMTVAVGTIGNEGMAGIELFFSDGATPVMAVVQTAGYAYRIDAASFNAKCRSAPSCQRVLLSYADSLINIVSLTAACNRFHTIKQRLALWLLDSADHIDADRLPMTHEQIAGILGSRRESVTLAADSLSHSNIIKLARGKISILDRPGLESSACECYLVIAAEYKHLRWRIGQQYLQKVRSPFVPSRVGQAESVGM